jgi:hypothetical protein
MKKFWVYSVLLGIGMMTAAQTQASDLENWIDVSASLHSGNDQASLGSSTSMWVGFGARRGRSISPFFSINAGLLNGEAIKNEAYFGIQGFLFQPIIGLDIRPFQSSTVQPFFGAGAAFGGYLLRTNTPPSGGESSEQGFMYGYTVHAGFAVTRIQVKATLRKQKAKYTGTKFDMSDINLSLGVIF